MPTDHHLVPDDLFKVHLLNEQGKAKATALAHAFTQLLTHVEAVAHEGRDLAIARTKLQEASFFAKRAMACDPVNQEAPDAHAL